MHFTVVYVDHDVAGVGAGQRTLLHLFHDSLEDGGHEAGIDGTADNAVVEDQLATPLQRIFLGVADGVLGLVGHAVVVGLDEHVHLAELAATTRLFLVAIHGLGALGDGLAVGDVGGGEVDGQLVLVLEVPLHGVEVELTLASEDDLTQFAAVLQRKAAVVGDKVLQGSTDFFVVVAVDGLHGDGVDGSREDDLLDGVVGVLRGGEGMVNLHVLQLDGADNVTGAGLLDTLAVAAAAHEHLADTLLTLVAGINHILCLGQFAVVDAEIGDFTEVFVLGALEGEGHGGVGIVALQFLAAFGLLGIGHLAGCRDVLADELKQTVDTEVLLGRGAEDGEEVALVYSEFQGLSEFLRGEVAILEIFLHEGIVGSGCFLNKGHAHLLGLVGILSRNVGFGHLAIGEGKHFVGHNIDHLIEAEAGVGGELQHGALATEVVFQLVDGVVEVGFLGIKVIDDEEHRGVELGCIAVGNLGADLHTTLGVDHDDGSFDHVEGTVELTLIVGETRHIEDVYLLAAELGVHEGVLHGVAAVVLDVAIVANGVFAVHAATTVNEAAAESHGFGHGGLATLGAAHEGDVANVVSLVNFHC